MEVLCQQHEDSGETPPFLQVTLTPRPRPHHHRHLPHLTSPHLPPTHRPQDVLAILYKTDEADDFVAPADEQVA